MNGTVTDNMTDVLDLPRLYASHTPGFEFRNTTEASGDPSMTVFESDQTDFCIRYSVDYLRTDDGYETFADLYFAGEGTMDPDEYLTCWGPGLLRLGAIMSFGGYCVSRPGLLRLGAVVG